MRAPALTVLSLVTTSLFTSLALAGPIGSGFSAGAIRATGFPDPLRQMTQSPVGFKTGSGGGSTGGGFAGFSSASVGITDSPENTTLSINGSANHYNFDGFTGTYAQTPIVLEITRPVTYEITNTSGTYVDSWVLTEPVTFEAITGSITSAKSGKGQLGAGTYRITFGVGAGYVNSFGPTALSPWYGQFGDSRISSTEIHWSMKLAPIPVTYGIGSANPSSVYYVQGQSFTPSSFGNLASPPFPASKPASVKLAYFSIAYDLASSTPFDHLYIYAAPPTPDAAATGAGSLATGAHIGGGVYAFDNVPLDYTTKYYAVLPYPASIFDGPGDIYKGGVDLFPRLDLVPVQVAEGYGDYDIGFDATFAFVPGCPADLNNDGQVDDADFSLFIVAYNILLCGDPAMPANCPSNLNSDIMVDDADFSIFVVAYNDLLCP